MGTVVQSTFFQTTASTNAANLSDNELLDVPVGVTLAQITIPGGVAVFSNSNNTSLFNAGSIYTLDPNVAGAVIFLHGDINIDNTATGIISGGFAGISMGSTGINSITNAGVITAATPDPTTLTATGVLLHGTPATLSLTNSGYIFGESYGVWVNTSGGAGGLIDNFGTITSITSTGISILVDTTPSTTTFITNEADGVIGNALVGPPTSAIVGKTGKFTLSNFGTINGTINDTDHLSDVVVNSGTINGGIFITGSVANFGNITGVVFLSGDSLYVAGASGRVGAIDVGAGSATVGGGTGADQFFFDSLLAGQFTKILNFTPSQHDKIHLSETDFANLGSTGPLSLSHFDNGAAKHNHPEIVYTRGNGFLYYDSNGNQTGGLHHFATLASHPLLTPAIAHASFVVFA
jgi:hypothetical protein